MQKQHFAGYRVGHSAPVFGSLPSRRWTLSPVRSWLRRFMLRSHEGREEPCARPPSKIREKGCVRLGPQQSAGISRATAPKPIVARSAYTTAANGQIPAQDLKGVLKD
jgi:hypothetical protein